MDRFRSRFPCWRQLSGTRAGSNSNKAGRNLQRCGLPWWEKAGRSRPPRSQRSIESHLGDYEAKLRAANRTKKHIRYTRRFVAWICDFAGFRVAADISADGVHRYAERLRRRGRSSRTIQSHLNAIKWFTKWLAEHHKLPRDPLASVRTPNPDTDRRFERRMVLPNEWPWLRAATQSGPDRYGMTAVERFVLYATAVQTGLRSNELRCLRRGKCFLDASPPYITCRASTTKSRKEARQYVEAQLAGKLQELAASRSARTPLFSLPHESNLARMLRDDLAAARNAWQEEAENDPVELARREKTDFLMPVNDEGEVLDFHSLCAARRTRFAALGCRAVREGGIGSGRQESA